MAPTFLVTAADEYTGFKLCHYILQLLATGTPYDELALEVDASLREVALYAAVGDPNGPLAQTLARYGATLVASDPETGRLLDEAALAGMDYVLIVPSARLIRTSPAARTIKACRQAGVRNVLLWSSICNQQTNTQFLSQYRRLETVLRETLAPTDADPAPTNWAIVRAGWYMEYLYLHQRPLQAEARLELPFRTGYIAPVRLRDLAMALLHVMHDMSRTLAYHRTFNFTGPDLLTGHLMGQIASHALRTPVELAHTTLEATAEFLRDQALVWCPYGKAAADPGFVSTPRVTGAGGPISTRRVTTSFGASSDSSDVSPLPSPVQRPMTGVQPWPIRTTPADLGTNVAYPDQLPSPFRLEAGHAASPTEGTALVKPDDLPITHPVRLVSTHEVDVLTELYEMARLSRLDLLTGDLAAVLGRRPETLATFLHKKRRDFLGGVTTSP
ncbi:hypothetical protein IWQ60_003138 [Tieghemiomyces parasiticus]|uniref:NAD(P)-binding domain-containing protein n=1 Tax=Tieghemiomyces parasiticus TaxID=78921 RepID=A0A9W8DV32_9FUNG|nr:hypothetical protein IWQ60_003138 [Tieghemiomyces parasiticus]